MITDAKSHHDDSMIDMIKDESQNKSFIPAYFLMGRDGLVFWVHWYIANTLLSDMVFP